MQGSKLLALLLAATMTLSGCFGGDDDENHGGEDHCADGHMDDECPGNDPTHCDDGHNDTHCPENDPEHCDDGHNDTHCEGNGTTTPTPNVPPTVVLTVTNATGAATVSTLMGGTLTFDIAGSSDPDGELTDAAVIVEDGNGTRSATVADGGEFMSATFQFDYPGVVPVTINALDDDGDKTSLVVNVYVDEPQDLGAIVYHLADPGLGDASTCAGPASSNGAPDNPIDPLASGKPQFRIREGAQWVEATATGSNTIAICAPDGTPLSEGASDYVRTTPGGAHAYNASAEYYVMVYSSLPENEIQVNVIVHYEPEAVAAIDEAAGEE